MPQGVWREGGWWFFLLVFMPLFLFGPPALVILGASLISFLLSGQFLPGNAMCMLMVPAFFWWVLLVAGSKPRRH
jgi:hypothetical protein